MVTLILFSCSDVAVTSRRFSSEEGETTSLPCCRTSEGENKEGELTAEGVESVDLSVGDTPQVENGTGSGGRQLSVEFRVGPGKNPVHSHGVHLLGVGNQGMTVSYDLEWTCNGCIEGE